MYIYIYIYIYMYISTPIQSLHAVEIRLLNLDDKVCGSVVPVATLALSVNGPTTTKLALISLFPTLSSLKSKPTVSSTWK